jgi:hypothetical protein
MCWVDIPGLSARRPVPAPLSIRGVAVRRADDRPATAGLLPGAWQGYATLEEQAMMPYQSYQLWDTARARTASEQRAADERLGKLAAAISGSFSQARRKVRAVAGLRSELGRSAQLADADADAAAYMRAAG